jgi:dihydroorotase
MTKKTLIRNITVVYGDKPHELADVLIIGSIIADIAQPKSLGTMGCKVIDGTDKYLLPGIIDDQVHFREPGLTEKATIHSESRAAVAGGITSFMEMPNTIPNTVTNDLLEEKYARASETSLANYSFYLGGTNDNIRELLKVRKSNVCGIKLFMGSSTGNMLVDSKQALEEIFKHVDKGMLIATHCENDIIIKQKLESLKSELGEENLLPKHHPIIRSAEACYSSSSLAVELAKKHKTRLHVLHISTERELSLFENDIPLAEKRITAEVCIHHLWFSDKDYESKGNFIKWNPAVKTENDRDALWKGLSEGYLDIIATDHAPHTLSEKSEPYYKAPSGGPLVQHGLNAMLQMHNKGKIGKTMIVQKMCNNPAILYKINKRGFIREGYFADLVIIDVNAYYTVGTDNILYKCGWSPFEGQRFDSVITHTFVNGHLAYENGKLNDEKLGQRLLFNR